MKSHQKAARIGGIDPRAQAIIEGLQPHVGGNHTAHALWRLHELERIDKHRTITAALLMIANTGIVGGDNVHVERLTLNPGGRTDLVDGAVLIRYGVARPRDPSRPMYMQFGLGFDVRLTEPSLGQPIQGLPFLRELDRYVANDVVAPLRAYL